MVTYGAYGAQIAANGYHVIPIVQGQKYPAVKNWSHLTEPPPFDEYAGCGIGIRCGVGPVPVYAVDVDVVDDSIANAIHKIFVSPLYRTGKPPKRLHLFKGETVYHKQISEEYKGVGKIEVLGIGQQFVAFGVHPDVKRPYQWGALSVLDTLAVDLPVLHQIDILKLFDTFKECAELAGFETKGKQNEKPYTEMYYEPGNPIFDTEPIGLSIEKLTGIVNAFEPDSSRRFWLNVGFALHHETSGSAEGLRIWDTWSARGTKYKSGEPAYYWGNFRSDKANVVTARFLLEEYKDTTKVTAGAEKEPDTDVEAADFFTSTPWGVDRFSEEPPPLQTIIEGMLPKAITALVFSAGGVGKSTVILYLAVRIASAGAFPSLCFFGKAVNSGAVVILTAEDPDDVINRRFSAIVKSTAGELQVEYNEVKETLQKNLFIVSTFGHPVHLFQYRADKNTFRKTKYFDSFLNRLNTIPDLQLVVIDTKTRFSPGEGQGNVTATMEIAYYEHIAQITGATVMLLHHTSKKSRDGSQDGQQAYRDATAIFDSVRAAWYIRPLTKKEKNFEGLDDIEARKHFVFENSKNNYIETHPDLLIRREGYSYSHKMMQSRNMSAEDLKDYKKQELIDAVVSYLQSLKKSTALQSDIIKEMKTERNVGRSRVVAALDAAIDDGLIAIIGSEGKGNALNYTLTTEGREYGLIVE